VVPTHVSDVLGITEYGLDFAAMIRRDNVMGAQFHPEKSHTFGMQILKNFTAL
jgi:glutamine amidotransferase